MTLYEKLFNLKYKQGVPTCELAHLFPAHIDRVNEVALLDIPEPVLKELVREEKVFERLINLKKRLKAAS